MTGKQDTNERRAPLSADDQAPRAREMPVATNHHGNTRDHADALILAALVGGKTQAQAAEIAGVAPKTVTRRLQDPVFARKLNDLRRDLIERTTDALTAGTTKATNALLAVMDDPNARPGERATAAKTLLDSQIKFQEQSIILRRMRVLEDGVAADGMSKDSA